MSPSISVRLGRSVAMLLCAVASISASAKSPSVAQPASAADPPAAWGLIVKLRAAPDRQHALAATGTGNPAPTDAERLHGVMAAAGLPQASLLASGRAAQHLNFGRVLDGAEAARMAEALRARPEVEWVVPNEREQRLVTPTDPMFSSQWWLRPVAGSNANAIADRLRGVPGFQSAWSVTVGGPAAIVAVLDTGITAHADISAHVLPGYDFVSEVDYANDGDGRDADPSDPGDWVTQDDKAANPALFGKCSTATSSWHGTVIAGLIAAVADNGEGGAGVSLDGRVLPVRVAGKCGATVADIVEGMRWAAGLPVAGAPANPTPARIINISFGGNADCNPAYQEAIDEIAAQRGAVVVAAAGNEHGSVNRPANCRGVVGVAAVNRDGFKANYSNFGPQIVIASPGGDPQEDGKWGSLLGDDGLLSADNTGIYAPDVGGYSRLFGTSFAAPLVAGTISLMLSANPTLTAAQIIAGLRSSARPHVVSSKMGSCSSDNPGRCICTTSTCGAGLLDAAQAVNYALNPLSYVPPAQAAVFIDSQDVDRAVALGADEPANVAVASSTSSGGGALGLGWLLVLALAVGLLRRAQAARPA